MKSATTKDSDKPSKGKDSSNSFAFKEIIIVVNSLICVHAKKGKRKENIELLIVKHHPPI